MSALRFETVSALPDPIDPGTVYFVRRADGDMDTVVGSKDAEAVFQRVPRIQMHVESTPGLLPADAQFGRYYATEPLELLAGLSGMRADVATTNVSVVRVFLGAVLVATATFAAGSAQATIDILQADIAAPALLIFKTPVTQDPTLSGVVGTFVARRT